jgi:hypothetical protein
MLNSENACYYAFQNRLSFRGETVLFGHET